jgi:deoxyribose-phosphate aldolase
MTSKAAPHIEGTMKLKADDLIGRLDYSLLTSSITEERVAAAAKETIRYRFNSLCVLPWLVGRAAELLKPAGLAAGTVVAFPLGGETSSMKAAEAREGLREGAGFVDMVVAIGMIKSGDFDGFQDELAVVMSTAVSAAASLGASVSMRAILETGLLTEEEADRAAVAAAQSGYTVKTSTGFGPRGAEVAEVARLSKLLSSPLATGRVGAEGTAPGRDGHTRIKASGGIKNAEQALAMFAAGAYYVGTSSAPAIADELRQMEERGDL